MDRQFKRIRCTINGRAVDKMVDVRASLTDLLRDDFSLTSVKKGCEVGECGACTVLIDGETYNSCIYLAAWADGKDILTVDGLTRPDGSLSPIQQAFVDEGAIQCGFCTPGFLLTGQEILNRGEDLTDEQLQAACRTPLPLHGLREHLPSRAPRPGRDPGKISPARQSGKD